MELWIAYVAQYNMRDPQVVGVFASDGGALDAARKEAARRVERTDMPGYFKPGIAPVTLGVAESKMVIEYPDGEPWYVE